MRSKELSKRQKTKLDKYLKIHGYCILYSIKNDLIILDPEKTSICRGKCTTPHSMLSRMERIKIGVGIIFQK